MIMRCYWARARVRKLMHAREINAKALRASTQTHCSTSVLMRKYEGTSRYGRVYDTKSLTRYNTLARSLARSLASIRASQAACVPISVAHRAHRGAFMARGTEVTRVSANKSLRLRGNVHGNKP
uniref:Uncharacterized protein n=1 Tax=Glypta fumiferanae TaxID=389681 RepID=A0A0F6QA83_9HYME|nr:hypothetical protein [Glypta fumiferanae]